MIFALKNSFAPYLHHGSRRNLTVKNKLSDISYLVGAGNRIRTGDLLHGKHTAHYFATSLKPQKIASNSTKGLIHSFSKYTSDTLEYALKYCKLQNHLHHFCTINNTQQHTFTTGMPESRPATIIILRIIRKDFLCLISNIKDTRWATRTPRNWASQQASTGG